MNVTMYGILICPDCVDALELLKKEESIQVEFKDFAEVTTNLKEFLSFRDTEAMFDEVRKEGNIGIPLFVFEDGTKTFDVNEVLALAKK